jgi:hypothetical protein
MWTGATLGCDCRIKSFNYSLKKRADGKNLPANSFEKKPSKRSTTNKAFALDRYCRRGRKASENYCSEAPPKMPIDMNNLNGFKLCGKRGG